MKKEPAMKMVKKSPAKKVSAGSIKMAKGILAAAGKEEKGAIMMKKKGAMMMKKAAMKMKKASAMKMKAKSMAKMMKKK